MAMTCSRFCTATLVVIVAIVAMSLAPLARRYANGSNDQQFAFMTTHNATFAPAARHSRYRGPEYANDTDHFFFQWWNFLIYDGDTHDHWSLMYSVTDFSEQPSSSSTTTSASKTESNHQRHRRREREAHRSDYVSVAMGHFTRSRPRMTVRDTAPLADVTWKNEFDLRVDDVHGRPQYSQTIIDADTYQLTARFYKRIDGVVAPYVSWNLTVHRTHGYYGAGDAEQGNHDFCTTVSTLFGYNSEVDGTVTYHHYPAMTADDDSGDASASAASFVSGEGSDSVDDAAVTYTTRIFTFDRSSRFRVYAAGSWGCQLPHGTPAVDHPWSWFWLSVPGADGEVGRGDGASTTTSLTVPSFADTPTDGGLVERAAEERHDDAAHDAAHDVGSDVGVTDVVAGRGRRLVADARDIGMVGGTGRFGALGGIEGGFAAVAIGGDDAAPDDRVRLSARYATMLDHLPRLLKLPLQASAGHGNSDDVDGDGVAGDGSGYLSHFRVHRSRWTTFADVYGRARIPLRQRFEFASNAYEVVVDFHSTLDQYFRAPVSIEGDGGVVRVFSDFRAVGVATYVRVTRKAAAKNNTDAGTVLYDGWIDTMNAVEYAYEAPVHPRLFAIADSNVRLQPPKPAAAK